MHYGPDVAAGAEPPAAAADVEPQKPQRRFADQPQARPAPGACFHQHPGFDLGIAVECVGLLSDRIVTPVQQGPYQAVQAARTADLLVDVERGVVSTLRPVVEPHESPAV